MAASSPRRWSVRAYLALIVLFASAVLGAMTVYGFARSADHAGAAAKRRMELQSSQAAAAISTSLATAKRTATGLAAQPGLAASFRASRACQLSADGTQAFPNLRIDIVTGNGRVSCSSSPAASSTAVHHGSAWLRAALRARGTLVDLRATDPMTRQPAVVVAAPVPGPHGPAGAVAVLMALPPTAAALAHSFGGINHAAFSVVNQATGAVLASSVLPANRLARVRFEHLQSTGDWKGIDGSRRLFGSARVPGTNWRVYSGVPRSTVLADARDTLTREALLGILALLILALAAWALNRRVAAPLRAIARHVGAQMGAEPDESRIHESGTAEIAALARGFNAMLDVRAGHEAQLAYQASHDPLTGLPNRVALREQLAVALRDETRTSHTVMCVGIDRLDVINDSFGHDVGERLLAAVVTRLSNMVRPGDTLARFGGDEFVVVCGDLACGEETGLAERLQACFEEPFAGPDGDVVIHASIGIAELGAAGSADELLRQADSAMREARRTGVAFSRFDRALQDRATRQVRVENDLRQAVKRDEFVVHYQPLLDLRSGRIVGAEALVRWSHPQRGVVPPIDFVPLAEQTGQIVQIGRLVLEKACHQAAAWRLSGQALRISVNAAVAQLRDRGFAADVARILDETGLPAEQLCLEITESSLLNAAGSGIAGIEALRRLGVRIAIDDFGTGYSSLAYLHQMPVDELKIDRSFVSRLERDERDRHLVVAILGMAHALDLSVVAEGVETDMQHELLRRFGCELAQGYLFSPPRSADEFAGLLEDRSARQAVSAAA